MLFQDIQDVLPFSFQGNRSQIEEVFIPVHFPEIYGVAAFFYPLGQFFHVRSRRNNAQINTGAICPGDFKGKIVHRPWADCKQVGSLLVFRFFQFVNFVIKAQYPVDMLRYLFLFLQGTGEFALFHPSSGDEKRTLFRAVPFQRFQSQRRAVYLRFERSHPTFVTIPDH